MDESSRTVSRACVQCDRIQTNNSLGKVQRGESHTSRLLRCYEGRLTTHCLFGLRFRFVKTDVLWLSCRSRPGPPLAVKAGVWREGLS